MRYIDCMGAIIKLTDKDFEQLLVDIRDGNSFDSTLEKGKTVAEDPLYITDMTPDEAALELDVFRKEDK